MKNRISELRKNANMSTNDLAILLDLNIRTVQRYESGDLNPPPDKLLILSKIFNCSIDYILYAVDEKNKYFGVLENNDNLTNINPLTKKIFIERLKELMFQKELTKDTLAKTLKVDINLINDYANGGKFPDIESLKKMSQRLGTTIDYLVGTLDNSGSRETDIFIAGEYITKYEDEQKENRVMITAPATLNQIGNKITGHTTNKNRKWLIEGEISSNGYIYGIYYADEPTDKGIGNFFLTIDNDHIMNGLWSGYDSVNKKITSGQYTFKPIYKNFYMIDLKEKHIPSVLEISDNELGKDYLSYSDIEKVLNDKNYICKIAIDKDTNKVIAFGLCLIVSPDEVKKIIDWPDNKISRALKHSNEIGVLKTISVLKDFQGKGIGKLVTERCYNELIDREVNSICSIAWKNGNITNIGGILLDLGFNEYASINDYWKDDSINKNYNCPVCGKPPCRCIGVIYTKILN